jgi:hypothetical protein
MAKVSFHYVKSGQKISGIAYKNNEGIVTSFKLTIQTNDFNVNGIPVNHVLLKVAFKEKICKICNIFIKIFVKDYGSIVNYMNIKERTAQFQFELNDAQLNKSIKSVENFLSNPQIFLPP